MSDSTRRLKFTENRRLESRHGRGALSNRDGRFEPYAHEPVVDDAVQGCTNPLRGGEPRTAASAGTRTTAWMQEVEQLRSSCRGAAGWGSLEEELPPLKTTVSVDATRTVIARNDSPDIPFEQSINPYRGCEHGCIYCYARPSHTYLGFSAGLDFETRLIAKPEAARLLAAELRKPGYRVSPIALGSNTDPYQPVERKWRITRRILEVLAAHEHPLTIVTKSALVERDLDILAPMAEKHLCAVFVSVTTLDNRLARRLEPRASAPPRRFEAIRSLAQAGVPVGVMFAPAIPALNDHEMEKVLEAATGAGARFAGWTFLRLPHEIKDLFKEWLAAHVPGRAEHVMSLIRQSRGGRDNDPRFGHRFRGEGEYAGLLAHRFRLASARLGLNRDRLALDTACFRLPARAGDQLALPVV